MPITSYLSLIWLSAVKRRTFSLLFNRGYEFCPILFIDPLAQEYNRMHSVAISKSCIIFIIVLLSLHTRTFFLCHCIIFRSTKYYCQEKKPLHSECRGFKLVLLFSFKPLSLNQSCHRQALRCLCLLRLNPYHKPCIKRTGYLLKGLYCCPAEASPFKL